MPLDRELVARLACPKCHGPLDERTQPEGFACAACKLLFKVEDGVPNFLLDDAQPLAVGAP